MAADPRVLSDKRDHLRKALALVDEVVAISQPNRVELAGAVKCFEMAYELAWKLLKAALVDGGHDSGSSRDVFRRAFQLGWIDDEALWLEMIRDRNDTVHAYNEDFAREIFARLSSKYAGPLRALLDAKFA